MSCRVDIISIGTLSRNRFWNEQGTVRPSHATTTLIRDGSKSIIVDPSLPVELLVHRLHERSGLKPSQIDMVFLTNFLPTHRRSLDVFEEATWLISFDEREIMGEHLNRVLDQGFDGDNPDEITTADVEHELALLGRTEIAPEKITPKVHLFPSPGPTFGSAALLVADLKSWIIAGDAVLTREHFDTGRIWERCADIEQARTSFADIIEIADLIVPGHDNLFVRS